MECKTIKRGAEAINIYFDGAHYVFNSRFAGLFLIATRNCNRREEGKQFFTVMVGNSHNYSDSDNRNDLTSCKRLMSRMEHCAVIFEDVTECELNEHYSVTLSINKIR